MLSERYSSESFSWISSDFMTSWTETTSSIRQFINNTGASSSGIRQTWRTITRTHTQKKYAAGHIAKRDLRFCRAYYFLLSVVIPQSQRLEETKPICGFSSPCPPTFNCIIVSDSNLSGGDFQQKAKWNRLPFHPRNLSGRCTASYKRRPDGYLK